MAVVVEREPVRVVDVEGRIAEAQRIVDVVELMYRRRQVDARQRAAAAMYLEALERIGGGMGSVLGQDGSGGGAAACSPTEAELRAARRLAEAARLLGQIDGRIVAEVVGHGHEVKAVAARLFGRGAGRPTPQMVRHVGMRLRLALDVLADAWVARGSFG